MRGAMLYAPRDIRVEDRADPKITEPTDVIIRLASNCQYLWIKVLLGCFGYLLLGCGL